MKYKIKKTKYRITVEGVSKGTTSIFGHYLGSNLRAKSTFSTEDKYFKENLKKKIKEIEKESDMVNNTAELTSLHKIR